MCEGGGEDGYEDGGSDGAVLMLFCVIGEVLAMTEFALVKEITAILAGELLVGTILIWLFSHSCYKFTCTSEDFWAEI